MCSYQRCIWWVGFLDCLHCDEADYRNNDLVLIYQSVYIGLQ
jgi:hypothetical protein